ncbi:MAG UNVERIFIED_CONTAM: FHA domain-containing protein [Anaerolineae bacterium]
MAGQPPQSDDWRRNDICIQNEHVSRRHAIVAYREELGGFVVDDPGSANGTFLNDKLVRLPTRLCDGDEIRLYVPIVQYFEQVTEQERVVAQRGHTHLRCAQLWEGQTHHHHRSPRGQHHSATAE